MDHCVVILAAGKGTRMKSDTVKVLHELASRPMLAYSLDLGRQLGPKELFVVIGFQADRVREAFSEYTPSPRWIVQPEQRGTADAVRCVIPCIDGEVRTAVILYGDVPLLKKSTVEALMAGHAHEGNVMTVLTAELGNPHGYGRILRDERGRIRRIVEEADADEAQRRIREINTGIYCIETAFLRDAVGRLNAENAQGEYYLTDLVEYAADRGLPLGSIHADAAFRALGINTREDLAEAERILREDTGVGNGNEVVKTCIKG